MASRPRPSFGCVDLYGYLSHDFLPLPNERLKLFFPMADLDRLFLRQ